MTQKKSIEMIKCIRHIYYSITAMRGKKRKHREKKRNAQQPTPRQGIDIPVKVVGGGKSVDEKKAAPYAIIYKSELDYISRCILDYKDIETGGQLFGFWTTEGVPVVLYVIGPGPRANHQVAFFVQDLDYLSSIGNKIVYKYGLQHIGEWHSHHKLGLASPSGHDASTVVKAMRTYRKRRCLLCIGNCDNFSTTVNAFNFHEYDLNSYVHATWEIKDLESPFRRIIDNGLGQELIHPRTSLAAHRRKENVTATAYPQSTTKYWFQDKNNHIVLKHIIDYLEELHFCKPSVKQDSKGFIYLVIRQNNGICIRIDFPQDFPNIAPNIEVTDIQGQDISNHRYIPKWQFDGNIFNSFKDYYKSTSIQMQQ